MADAPLLPRADIAIIDPADVHFPAGGTDQRCRLLGAATALEVTERHAAAAFGELHGDGATDAARAADHA